MRYRRDKHLKAECDKQKRLLLGDEKGENPVHKEFTQMLKNSYESGFDDGCKASSIYSDVLKELYKPVEVPKLKL